MLIVFIVEVDVYGFGVRATFYPFVWEYSEGVVWVVWVGLLDYTHILFSEMSSNIGIL